jgi:hypothetical protein
MISSSCSLKSFVEGIKHREYRDIIYLAEQEAVEAWRLAQRRIRKGSLDHQESMRYSETLKELIFLLIAEGYQSRILHPCSIYRPTA